MTEEWKDINKRIRNDHITQVCNHTKHYKTAGGFHWKYVERRDEQ